MEQFVAHLLQELENGKMTRRDVIQKIVLAAGVASAGTPAEAAAPPAGGLKTLTLDHISYQVDDYRKTRDFYADLMGMTVAADNGTSQCELHFGESMIIARNRSRTTTQSRVDHIAYRVDDWNTDKVKVELERRKLNPRLDTGGAGGPRNYSSFHILDPDGFDLQISGIAKPGDSQYRP